jgi:endoglucanase
MEMAMMNKSSVVWSVVTLSGLLGAVGCQPPMTGEDAQNLPEAAACGPEALIDDGEDNNNQVAVNDGRSGYWYTYVDSVGSSITPTAGSAGGIFTWTAGGANGSAFAARMNGNIGAAPVVFAGMGMNFADPKGPYDASKYQGVAFWAKKGVGATANVRIKFPDSNTDPDGGVCSACYNDHGRNIKLADEWEEFFMPFYSLSQEKGWGSPKTSSVESTGLYSLQFQVNEKGATYDVWVDDLRFTGCE